MQRLLPELTAREPLPRAEPSHRTMARARTDSPRERERASHAPAPECMEYGYTGDADRHSLSLVFLLLAAQASNKSFAPLAFKQKPLVFVGDKTAANEKPPKRESSNDSGQSSDSDQKAHETDDEEKALAKPQGK